ncbi:MAG: C40 family peptidase [Rhodoferax sp.]|uniref:C40 family peptidase n=1 Tax=Rhodoferax sp. TaxID=50421 RepID=UPI001400EDB1|nr:C40 family peptidase [Rhodoferax sp.]NDP39950.1 C40 family peptidase [Rhodoferax sp.]
MFDRLGLLLACLTLLSVLGGCGNSPSARRGLASNDALAVPSRISLGQADDITIHAVGLVGTPYRYGGNTPDSGFDCSGLIGYIYQKRAGLAPPRTVARMQYWGQAVLSDNIRSGDLVLFAQSNVVTHAGIYVGAGRFVHAPSTGGVVRLDKLNSKYWSSQQVTFRRP